MEIPILHYDEHYVVVHKPTGLLVHRTSIDAHAERPLLQILRDQIGRHVYPVHRLDKGTSGVIALALHREAADRLAQAFREGLVAKHYVAIVRGYAPELTVVDWPLRDAIEARQATARPAQTDVQRLASAELAQAVGRYPTARYSLVGCVPHSGRQHQIRRHLKHLRHPVIGDANYGDLTHNRFFRNTLGVGRLLLAATALRFAHPYDDSTLSVVAPVDDSFAAACRALGWDAGVAAWPVSGTALPAN